MALRNGCVMRLCVVSRERVREKSVRVIKKSRQHPHNR